jgi:FixJ family two-component response regulator
MTEASFTVSIVDDDPAVLKALGRLLRTKGYDSRSFSSPSEFLAQHDPSAAGCAILDLSMPGLDGIELQQVLAKEATHFPVIFISGKGDIPTSVRAMRAGAVDFLTKPVNANDLVAALARARAQAENALRTRSELDAINARLARLTPREREVLEHVIAGQLNKQIAADLGTVEKTVKVHRGRLMNKMEARSVTDLVRLAERAGIRPYGRLEGRLFP